MWFWLVVADLVYGYLDLLISYVWVGGFFGVWVSFAFRTVSDFACGWLVVVLLVALLWVDSAGCGVSLHMCFGLTWLAGWGWLDG